MPPQSCIFLFYRNQYQPNQVVVQQNEAFDITDDKVLQASAHCLEVHCLAIWTHALELRASNVTSLGMVGHGLGWETDGVNLQGVMSCSIQTGHQTRPQETPESETGNQRWSSMKI
jgi:hypothetical protein